MLEISENDFQKICAIMHNRTGVALKSTKKPLVVSRLRKRLEELGLSGFGEYIPLLEQPNSSELEIFINAITTNETFLFRHPNQFQFLSEKVLPDFLNDKSNPGLHEFRAWSAASSTGEEAYSIAITCQEFARAHTNFRFKIFASDVNSKVLARAREGVFPERSFRETPVELKNRYFKPVQPDPKRPIVDFALEPSIRGKVEFFQHNLLKSLAGKMFEIIFLRNVMIYFDKPVKEQVVNILENNLRPGGYFFISLSETLSDVRTGLKHLLGGIYQKQKA